MKNRKLLGIIIVLLLALNNFNRLKENENIRAIQFVSIFVLGMLTALLINELVTIYKASKIKT